jgi:hypothetical protein
MLPGHVRRCHPARSLPEAEEGGRAAGRHRTTARSRRPAKSRRGSTRSARESGCCTGSRNRRTGGCTRSSSAGARDREADTPFPMLSAWAFHRRLESEPTPDGWCGSVQAQRPVRAEETDVGPLPTPGGSLPHMGAPKSALLLIRTGFVHRNRVFRYGIAHAWLTGQKVLK